MSEREECSYLGGTEGGWSDRPSSFQLTGRYQFQGEGMGFTRHTSSSESSSCLSRSLGLSVEGTEMMSSLMVFLDDSMKELNDSGPRVKASQIPRIDCHPLVTFDEEYAEQIMQIQIERQCKDFPLPDRESATPFCLLSVFPLRRREPQKGI